MRHLTTAIAATLAILAAPAAGACTPDGAADCAVASGAYRIALPDQARRPGAMVWLHGMGGSAMGVMKNRGMRRTLGARGYALIAPDGLIPARSRRHKNWAVHDGRTYARDDIAFLAEVIADAVARHGIDPERILLAGFSRGGSLVWDAACKRPELARAFAPVAGAFWEPMFEACERPVDLFHTHGWTDRIVPLEGRPLRGGTMIQGDVFESLFRLRALNGCTNRQPATAPIDDGAGLWQRSWNDCVSGRRIDLMLHPGGHGVPRGWLERALDWFEDRLAAG